MSDVRRSYVCRKNVGSRGFGVKF